MFGIVSCFGLYGKCWLSWAGQKYMLVVSGCMEGAGQKYMLVVSGCMEGAGQKYMLVVLEGAGCPGLDKIIKDYLGEEI